MIDNMSQNLAFITFVKKNSILEKDQKKILDRFRKLYGEYRYNWLNAINVKNKKKPLSLDLEIAAICDLACPHCHREYLITPDKIMNEQLYKKLVDEAAELEIPSIKLIWRGEPLLHPKLKDFIYYAKTAGILEVIINTNATHLNATKAKELIDSGLDLLIYSFDGGTKETYEKMRPGRFKKNNFDDVYNNIKNFKLIKDRHNSIFPITKIQMIMTKKTRSEVNQFYELFRDCVDDITVTQYNERGGEIDDLDFKKKKIILDYLNINNLDKNTPYMVDIDDNIFISEKRRTCDQIYQRLMVTYSGKVGMCCHDWGAQHAIGYLSKESFEEDKEIITLSKKIEQNKKGFELLKNAIIPKNLNSPEKKIQSLKSLWQGSTLNYVREKHENNEINSIDVCKKCTFKDTYVWKKIN